MARRTNDLTTPSGRPAVRGLLIVARDRVDLYQDLQSAYGDSEEMTVLLDRRQADRRRAVQSVPGELRCRDRRSSPSIAHDLHCQQYVLVRPHYRRPRD